VHETPCSTGPSPPGPAAGAVAVGTCVDGGMAGEEVTVPLVDGVPPTVITVGALTYLLAGSSTPVAGSRWRYTVVRPGDGYVVDGDDVRP
jgi:hypothetical protein